MNRNDGRREGWSIECAHSTTNHQSRECDEDVRAGGNPSRMYVEKQLVGEEQEVRTDRSSSGFPGPSHVECRRELRRTRSTQRIHPSTEGDET